ncbi:hypothetical protein L596_006251 [Steinernema carpocapsae]|uniref:Transmembrane protein 231 n=1 Tax=Steinernema carpocapsae TaxID=34508 RepID=A0A4U8V1K9_STECR|nr:hypothetical protein L596_006251 [Steinernema carpocapsae]
MTTGEVVHEEVITKKYRAASPWAHVVHALIYITTLVLPLVLAFVSQGFWRKVEVYREQPIVEFTGKCVLLLQGEREGDYAVWSTFQTLNQASESHLKVPTLETEQKDHDGDERYDRITVVAEFSSVRFPVRSVLWVLLFKYQLDQRFLVEMESAITGEAQTQLQAGSKLRIAGELNMLQKDLFDRNIRLETPFNCSSPDIEQFKPFSMLTTGLGQNFSTELARQKVVWEPALTPTNDFTLSFHVHVPPQVFYYKTGVFELLKWAWIQYLSLLIIVHYLLRQFASFVYENHLLAVTTD